MQVTNAREFELSVRYFGTKSVPEATRILRTKIALQMLALVVNKTPVKTGRAKGSWDVSINEPTLVPRVALDPSGGATIAAGSAIINGATEPFTCVWIQSNLPYIIALEHGHSTQAPKGMVLTSVAEVMHQFRGVK